MNTPLLDNMARQASLLTRDVAGLGEVRHSSVAAAKKKKKRKKKDPNEVCKKQAQVWELFVNLSCEMNPSPDCLDLLTCGEPLETCDFTGFFNCFRNISAP